MDVYCPVCGEPWDHDCLHEEAEARYGIPYYIGDDGSYIFEKKMNPEYNSDDYQKVFTAVKREFQSVGCKALTEYTDGKECKPRENQATDSTFGLTAAEASAALYDILGDDMDGAAAMLEDMGF